MFILEDTKHGKIYIEDNILYIEDKVIGDTLAVATTDIKSYVDINKALISINYYEQDLPSRFNSNIVVTREEETIEKLQEIINYNKNFKDLIDHIEANNYKDKEGNSLKDSSVFKRFKKHYKE